MFNKLSVKDFAVLRGPFESGRQSLGNMAVVLIFSIFIQGLLLSLEYHHASGSVYPFKNNIVQVHFFVTLIIFVLSAIYAIPAVYKRSQKMQYLLTVIITQNIGVMMYIVGLFVLGKERDITKESLLTLTNVTLMFGLLIFIITFIHYYVLTNKGEYRKGTRMDKIRGFYEQKTYMEFPEDKSVENESNVSYIIKSYMPIIIVSFAALVYISQFILRKVDYIELDDFLMYVLGFLIFYAILFVLPEQLVILYCKFRFKSFNFNQRGYLFSEDEDLEKNLIKEK